MEGNVIIGINAIEQQMNEALSSGRATLFIGSGVSIGATYGISLAECASWPGLIKHGLQHVVNVLGKYDTNWLKPHLDRLASGNMEPDDYIELASVVESSMQPHEFKRWLEVTIGQLYIKHQTTLNELVPLVQGNKVVTTNYDSLLELALKWPVVEWTDSKSFQQASFNGNNAIVHLHGHWRNPSSIVFGKHGYDKIQFDNDIQILLRNMIQNRSLVFIGCGDTLFDYNVGNALENAIKEFEALELHHYWLVRVSEVKECRQKLDYKFGPTHNIHIIPFGSKHDDLPAYLNRINSSFEPQPLDKEYSVKSLGELKRDFAEKTHDDWLDMVDLLRIPKNTWKKWHKGREPQELWDWLDKQDRLSELPDLLRKIDHTKLADLIEEGLNFT